MQIVGRLPWRNLRDRDDVLRLKEGTDFHRLLFDRLDDGRRCHYAPSSAATLVADALEGMRQDLQTLHFSSTPDYDWLVERIRNAC